MTLILYDAVDNIEVVLEYYQALTPMTTRTIKKYASQTTNTPRIISDQPLPTELTIRSTEISDLETKLRKLHRILQLGEKVLLVENARGLASLGLLENNANPITARSINSLPVDLRFVCDSNLLGTMKEAEDCSITGTITSDSNASGSKAVILDAVTERVVFNLTQTEWQLPEADYTLYARAKDTAQVANDFGLYVDNSTDATSIASSSNTLTANYAWYSLDFTIDSADIGDIIQFKASKDTSNANTISVDLLAIVQKV